MMISYDFVFSIGQCIRGKGNYIQSRIMESKDKEIGVSIFFDGKENIENLIKVVCKLDKYGFYIL